MGQIANCEYVCNAINRKKGAAFVPVSGTEKLKANCEYLLKMIDKANNNTTTYGAGMYATKQTVDKNAVDDAVDRLISVSSGKFVAVADSTNKAACSSDGGATWTAATLPSSADWARLAYGNGKFVAVAYGTNKAAFSSDGGATWTAATLPNQGRGEYSLAYGGGKFVAVLWSDSSPSFRIACSPDGVNWTEVWSGSRRYDVIVYGSGKFVAIAFSDGSGNNLYSSDGVTWTAALMSVNINVTKAIYGED